MDDLITGLLIGLLLVEGVCAVSSGVYIAWVYRQRKEDSVYLGRLVRRDSRVAAGAVPIVLVICYSLLTFANPDAFHPLPRPWGSILIGVPFAIFMFGVIDDAVQFAKDRKVGGQPNDRDEAQP